MEPNKLQSSTPKPESQQPSRICALMKVIPVMVAKVELISVLAKELMTETIFPHSMSTLISGEKLKGLVVKTSRVKNLNSVKRAESSVKLKKNSRILPSNAGVSQRPNMSHITAQLMEDNALVRMVMSSMVSSMSQEPSALLLGMMFQ